MDTIFHHPYSVRPNRGGGRSNRRHPESRCKFAGYSRDDHGCFAFGFLIAAPLLGGTDRSLCDARFGAGRRRHLRCDELHREPADSRNRNSHGAWSTARKCAKHDSGPFGKADADRSGSGARRGRRADAILDKPAFRCGCLRRGNIHWRPGLASGGCNCGVVPASTAGCACRSDGRAALRVKNAIERAEALNPSCYDIGAI